MSFANVWEMKESLDTKIATPFGVANLLRPQIITFTAKPEGQK